MIDVTMPQFSESTSEATVSKWHVRPGDLVRQDQTLLDVTTDKAVMAVPAPAAGRVIDIVIPEGVTVPCETLLCRLDETAN